MYGFEHGSMNILYVDTYCIYVWCMRLYIITIEMPLSFVAYYAALSFVTCDRPIERWTGAVEVTWLIDPIQVCWIGDRQVNPAWLMQLDWVEPRI